MACILALLAQSETAATLAQISLICEIIAILALQVRRIKNWKISKEFTFLYFEKPNQETEAMNKMYRLLVIETIILDCIFIPVLLCSLDFIGLFPYVISNGGF